MGKKCNQHLVKVIKWEVQHWNWAKKFLSHTFLVKSPCNFMLPLKYYYLIVLFLRLILALDFLFNFLAMIGHIVFSPKRSPKTIRKIRNLDNISRTVLIMTFIAVLFITRIFKGLWEILKYRNFSNMLWVLDKFIEIKAC